MKIIKQVVLLLCAISINLIVLQHTKLNSCLAAQCQEREKAFFAREIPDAGDVKLN